MPETSKIIQSFNAGELSPLMDARIDQDKYKFGCRTMENFFPLIYGAAQRRPGTEYIAAQKSSSAQGRVVAFEHSVDDTYMLLFENQNIRVFDTDGRITGTVKTLGNTATNITVFADAGGGDVRATASGHGLLVGDRITIAGTTSYNGNFAVTAVSGTTFDFTDTWGANDATGTVILNTVYLPSGTPVVIGLKSHGYITGDVVSFATFAVGGTVELNGNEYSVTKINANSFSLDGTDGDDFAAHTTGGTATWSGITTPYLTADLPDLDVKQSADVMFISHGSYEPRKLARTGDTNWTLTVTAFADGPFLAENTDMADTIVADATTGTVTLTAVGCTPFVMGTTAGHSPGGALVTSKSQTGALFKLVHAILTDSVSAALAANGSSSELEVYKGVTWDFVTHGTWTGTVKLEREYNNNGIWETVITVSSVSDKNIVTSGTETFADAQYRMTMSGYSAGTAEVQVSIRDSSHIGVVKITAVASTTSATATVLTTLGDIRATHRWSEGAWSNYRGWPRTVGISPEERLTFGGSTGKPLTVWGSVVGVYTSMKEGTLKDDAIIFSLIGTGQQNTINWMVPSSSLMLGTLGGEHLLGGSNEGEALTPANVNAKIKTTYGSENNKAFLINNAILFLQRGSRRIRELSNVNTNDASTFIAEDLMVFAEHIAGSGGTITDMAFQRTPVPMVWCVRSDGQIAVLGYERSQNFLAWCRFVTDGYFESVDVKYGGAAEEDEVWVTVRRVINGLTVRYVERFTEQNYTTLDKTVMVDCALIVQSTASAQDINLASDTVWYGVSNYGSSYYGGNYAGD